MELSFWCSGIMWPSGAVAKLDSEAEVWHTHVGGVHICVKFF